MEQKPGKRAFLRNADRKRCEWCGADPVYVKYHDTEWGVAVRNDIELFEMLILEGFQAGLSWLTILRKRENFRKAFKGFRPDKIARFGKRDVARLMQDDGIIRNRMKIEAAIANARAFQQLKSEGLDFADYIWSFTGGKTLRARRASLKAIPSKSPESVAMSKDLLKRGFKFVGPTICYAFMQATGLVDDHVASCFRAKRGKR